MPVTRIPLAPGNLPVRPVVDPRPPVVWTEVAKVSVMVVSGHSSDDPLRGDARILATQIESLGFPVTYKEVGHARELREALARERPNILYLSTHGTMTTELGAALHFPGGADPLWFEHFGGMPDVAIVSACRSDPVAGTYGSPTRNLYAAGARAVLGSYLNLTEPHATLTALGLFLNLHAALTGERRSNNWQDLVWLTLNMRRPIDILIGAVRWLERRSDDFAEVINLFEAYARLHGEEQIPIAECWNLVPERLKRIAKGTPFERAIDAVTARHAFRPESIFYTHVGSPNTILLDPGKLLVEDE
jgi:hypothetical protein